MALQETGNIKQTVEYIQVLQSNRNHLPGAPGWLGG